MCQCNDATTIILDVATVAEECRTTIEWIEAKRKEYNDAYIYNKMVFNEWAHKWFWWLGVKKLTTEEMIAKVLKDDSLSRMLTYPSYSHDETLETAKTVQRMCKASTDGKIRLSSRDFRCIF